jgi:RNA polymerase sigma-70 factor (ECF subfamily)
VTTTDSDEFERRVRENHLVVFQIAYGVLGNRGDAEDVVQETFLRAFQKAAGLREPGKFRAWVAQIGRRLALNRLRSETRSRRRETFVASEPPPASAAETVAEERAFETRVRAEIDALPEKLRTVVLLCSIEGLDHAAVARILSIPEGTVRSRLHAARKRLLETVGA